MLEHLAPFLIGAVVGWLIFLLYPEIRTFQPDHPDRYPNCHRGW